jgi:VWFA-related protein
MLKRALHFGLASGQTALYDALSYSLKHLEFSTLQRKSLIVVTDGRDNVSDIGLDQLMKELEASRATVYTVGLHDPDVINDLNAGVLRKISHVSGGEFFGPETPSEITSVFEQISKDIRHRYTIGYIPDESNNHRVLRRVKVIARDGNRKLLVHTRTSYNVTPIRPSASSDSVAEAH